MPSCSAVPGMSSIASINSIRNASPPGGPGEADATVPHHCRGDAVVDRRTHHGIPGGLAVVVGVHVDPTGGDERPVGLNLAVPAWST